MAFRFAQCRAQIRGGFGSAHFLSFGTLLMKIPASPASLPGVFAAVLASNLPLATEEG